jgi:hypothetical protein
VSDGSLVRFWRRIFGRDVHAECRAALETERLAYRYELDRLFGLLQDSQKRLLEVADPGINHRLNPQPRKEKPKDVQPKPPMVDLLPS